MFGSTVLEVAAGLVFCYASLALIVSSLQEAIAAALRLRARTLLAGIKTMLNDPQFSALAQALYQHALINPHGEGGLEREQSMDHKPSYIHPRHFAVAMVDNLQSIPGDFEQLGRDIDALPDPQLRQLMQGMYRRAAGDAASFHTALAGWFDGAMERVSGVYKRRAQAISVLLTLGLAVLFNIDSIHLFQSLWVHPVQVALQTDLWSLPIGWQSLPTDATGLGIQALGWLLTASSALFGAPFWFDLLQQLVRVRSTGEKPKS